MEAPTKPDLSTFVALGKKRNWDTRARLIREEFPSAYRLNWRKAFDVDIDLMGRVIRDILKLDRTPPGRPGPRPFLDPKEGMARLRQLMGDDFTYLPFAQAVRFLSGPRSGRRLAARAGLERTLVQRVLAGQLEPDVYVITEIARVFEKNPSYFLEYRVLYITNFLLTVLADAPESTVGLYRKIVTAEKQAVTV